MNNLNQLKARMAQTTLPPIALMNFTENLCWNKTPTCVGLTQEHKVVWHKHYPLEVPQTLGREPSQ